jgi:RNA polymerase primary sigma factor
MRQQKQQYHNPAMKELSAQQLRYAPHNVRLQQIERAERLIAELETGGNYDYQTICERLTTFRPERYPDLQLTGEDAAHDLRCFIEDLSETLEISADSVDEPVLTLEEVSRRYNVSTKTVSRWRKRGLNSRRFLIGNRKRIGFLQSAVDRFVSEHTVEVERGQRFTQLSDRDREDIIRRARRMARFGGGASEISKRLANRLSRSVETIRYTLRNYDRNHPENAVFPHANEPLTDDQKRQLYSEYRRGRPVEELTSRYGRTRTSIYRIVSEVRAIRLIEQPVDFMDSPEFHIDGAGETILGPSPEKNPNGGATKAPPGLPPYLASLYTVPLLSREEEGYYFRKMNYLKFKAAQRQEAINPQRPSAKAMDEIERLLDEAGEVKNFLIRSNLRLVVSIAKRHIKPNANFFEMVSDGNMSLIRAIEKFDYTKGNKFSTYASWAIMKNFARSIPAEHTLLDRYRTGNDELLDASRDQRANQFLEELTNHQQHDAIMTMLVDLDDRERDIIVHRYGLEKGEEPQTLEQVGVHMGVTKERIRQIEARALKKLRRIAQIQHQDIPGV